MKHVQLTDDLYQYLIDVSIRESDILQQLREKTLLHPLANMLTAPEQMQFIQFMLNMLDAKLVLEIGTFTGYSALAMAMVLPTNGKVITCDINTQWTNIGLPYWQKSGHGDKIDLKIAPAMESMYALLNDGLKAQFDFIFIDADKTNYVSYYELAKQLIKPAGVIAVDNVFWGGAVVDSSHDDPQTREIRRLNEKIKNDDDVIVSMLPIGDGLFLIKKK